MDFDVPTDLINKAQIGFREAVGLSSIDRSHTNLTSICTLEASIPSPSYRKCQYCQCKLPRGLQSLICIHCGEYQTNNRNPDPISFNSTRGYYWLLQSLNFNGSEPVGSLAEGSGINGGQSPAVDELPLSELLDLKISWRDDPKTPKNNFDIKTSEHDSSSNLTTPNFNFLTESKRDVVSDVPEEQPVASKADQNKTLENQESFTSDWNAEFQFADTKMENENLGTPSFDFFTELKRGIVSDVHEEQPVASKADQNMPFEDEENFPSDWNAEFKFADTKMENVNLESVNPYVGADAELSAHMDVVFGQKNDRKPIDDSDPFQDDLFADMNSVFQAKHGLSGDLNHISFTNADGDWFSDGNRQKSSASNMDTIKHDNIFEIKQDKHHSEVTDWFQDDDMFDGWNDLTSSTGNQDSWKENSNEKVGDSEKIAELNLFPSTDDSQEVDFGKLLMSDIFSGDKNPSDTRAVYDIFPEISTASRNANTEAGNSAEGSKNNDEITLDATRPENDVQMLMSQMHDLSFMVKNELSVPSKPDDLDPTHV